MLTEDSGQRTADSGQLKARLPQFFDSCHTDNEHAATPARKRQDRLHLHIIGCRHAGIYKVVWADLGQGRPASIMLGLYTQIGWGCETPQLHFQGSLPKVTCWLHVGPPLSTGPRWCSFFAQHFLFSIATILKQRACRKGLFAASLRRRECERRLSYAVASFDQLHALVPPSTLANISTSE